MRKYAVPIGFCLAVLVLAAAAGQVPDQLRKRVPARISAHIDAVTQEFPAMAINLIVTGSRFPSRSGERRVVLRLVGGRGQVTFEDANRMWTATRIESFLGFNIIAGRKYKIGIVQADEANASQMNLVSNEVEYLLLMHLHQATPAPVPLGTSEIRIDTAQTLGPQGSKIVKFGNVTAEAKDWGTAGGQGGFNVVIPSGLLRPAQHDVWIEEGGQIVSNKLSVRFLGPVIR